MTRKSTISRNTNRTNNPLVISSHLVPNYVEVPEGVEETEITAEISVPPEDLWGWVVVLASFFNFFILDGIFFTFGSLYQNMTSDMAVSGSLIALVNSIAIALYFMCGPIVSALTNRFGFRACTMTGSIILYFSYLCSYFVNNYGALLLFYGIIAGIGACLVLVPSSVVVGFYFERHRAIALALSGLGSSVGVMVMFTANSYLVNIAGWRIVTLIHAALFGTIYFLAMAYRPLLVVKLTQTTETNDPTRTVTYLPSMSRAGISMSTSRRDVIQPTTAERLFSAISNRNFPTAATVVQEIQQVPSTEAGSSSQPISKITISPHNTRSLNQKHIDRLQSMASNESDNINIELTVRNVHKGRRKWWKWFCCKWEEHVPQSRPMYRDDAFYTGEIKKLPIYQKSVLEVHPDARTGLEYHMAVSRAVTATDLEEHKGIFTTAVRRVLATMLDFKLLKNYPFLLICCSAALTYTGVLTPFVFVSDRGKSEGIEITHCNLFVSVIGFCGIIGRIFAGALASKFNALKLYLLSCIMTGTATILFNFSFNVFYQYFCCVFFGLFVSFISGLRSMVLVETFGLDKLTNATGMMLMFQGFGSLISTPMSGILKASFSYAVSFYVAGTAIIISGLVLLPVKILMDKETDSSLSNRRTGRKSQRK